MNFFTDIILPALVGLLIACSIALWNITTNQHTEIQALQAQVDKKYCEGEVTYPELVEESRR